MTDPINQHFPGEILRRKYFKYHGHPRLLSLEQGQFVLQRRLQELDFILSPSQPETPADGSCLFHSILDQIKFNPELRNEAFSHLEIRWKIVNYGYDVFLKTKKLPWTDVGTPEEWKRRMSNPSEWCDGVALQLASNVFSVDIVIIFAFQESAEAIDKNLGITIIKCLEKPKHQPIFLFLFPDCSFSPAHDQPIRPRSDQISPLSARLLSLLNDGRITANLDLADVPVVLESDFIQTM